MRPFKRRVVRDDDPLIGGMTARQAPFSLPN
jgi:hypothetical protein